MMSKPQRNMIQEYQEVLDVQEFALLTEDMPFARIGTRLANTARLFGRELERNVSNAVGQSVKVGQAALDTVNPFITFPHMSKKAKEMDQKIEQRLAAIDERYADAIAALWQSAQLTDFQAFLFMLNPALYLGTKTLPKALNFTVSALATATGQENNRFVRGVTRGLSTANQISTVGGPMANQPASYSGGGYGGGYGDYGGDYGGGGDY
jgi:hypothetical protein